jgi:hypothetical protein
MSRSFFPECRKIRSWNKKVVGKRFFNIAKKTKIEWILNSYRHSCILGFWERE